RGVNAAARFFADVFDGGNDSQIEVFVIAEAVVELFNIVQVFRQHFRKLADVVSGVGAMLRDRAFYARADARPNFFLADSRTDEKDVLMLRMPGREYGHTIGLIQSRQVIKICVLAELEIRVVVSPDVVGASEDRDAVRLHFLHKFGDSFWFHSLLL